MCVERAEQEARDELFQDSGCPSSPTPPQFPRISQADDKIFLKTLADKNASHFPFLYEFRGPSYAARPVSVHFLAPRIHTLEKVYSKLKFESIQLKKWRLASESWWASCIFASHILKMK